MVWIRIRNDRGRGFSGDGMNWKYYKTTVDAWVGSDRIFRYKECIDPFGRGYDHWQVYEVGKWHTIDILTATQHTVEITEEEAFLEMV